MDKIIYTGVLDGSLITMLLVSAIVDIKDTISNEERFALNDEDLEVTM